MWACDWFVIFFSCIFNFKVEHSCVVSRCYLILRIYLSCHMNVLEWFTLARIEYSNVDVWLITIMITLALWIIWCLGLRDCWMDDYDVLIFYANYAMYDYMSPFFIDALMAFLIISMMSREMCYSVSLFIYYP